MSNYLVAMEAAWLVRDIDDVEDAIGVAVSEAGRRLNEAGLEYVDINVESIPCPYCGDPFDRALVAANTALVGLGVEMEVLGADSEQHARRIAKSEVGGALREVPLEVLETFELDGEEERSPDGE